MARENPIAVMEHALRSVPDVGGRVYALQIPAGATDIFPCVTYSFDGDTLKPIPLGSANVLQLRRELAFSVALFARSIRELYEIGGKVLAALDATGRNMPGEYSGPILDSLPVEGDYSDPETGPGSDVGRPLAYAARYTFALRY